MVDTHSYKLSPFGPALQFVGGSREISANSFWIRLALLESDFALSLSLILRAMTYRARRRLFGGLRANAAMDANALARRTAFARVVRCRARRPRRRARGRSRLKIHVSASQRSRPRRSTHTAVAAPVHRCSDAPCSRARRISTRRFASIGRVSPNAVAPGRRRRDDHPRHRDGSIERPEVVARRPRVRRRWAWRRPRARSRASRRRGVAMAVERRRHRGPHERRDEGRRRTR